MPFTPTHIVAVLPFFPLRCVLPFSALAIGAMIPDLPLFVPIVRYAQTHTPAGVNIFDLPLGIAFFLLFECVLKQPLIALLPDSIGQRIPDEPAVRVGAVFFVGVAVAVAVGAYSHLVWDAFSHRGRWGTQLLPGLSNQYPIGSWMIPGYKMVQYGSSLIGLPALAFFAWIVLPSSPRPKTKRPVFAIRWKVLVWLIALMVPWVVGAVTLAFADGPYEALGLTITRSGGLLFAGVIVWSLYYQWRWSPPA